MKAGGYTKRDLAEELSLRFGITRGLANEVAVYVVECLSNGLRMCGRVEFRGFGVMEVRKRKARVGRNPRKPGDGEILVPARKVVKFRPSRRLDDRLNP